MKKVGQSRKDLMLKLAKAKEEREADQKRIERIKAEASVMEAELNSIKRHVGTRRCDTEYDEGVLRITIPQYIIDIDKIDLLREWGGAMAKYFKMLIALAEINADNDLLKAVLERVERKPMWAWALKAANTACYADEATKEQGAEKWIRIRRNYEDAAELVRNGWMEKLIAEWIKQMSRITKEARQR